MAKEQYCKCKIPKFTGFYVYGVGPMCNFCHKSLWNRLKKIRIKNRKEKIC